jgi:hypothetical protein
MENMEEKSVECEKIWKIWKKSRLNIEINMKNMEEK